VADLLRFVRTLPSAERTVVLYTADHGEQFREHGQLGHTGSVFDVEIHVPAWVEAPEGTLDRSERDALERHARRVTFHTDLTPTILDLMGLWDAAELATHRSAMVGSSLLRSHSDPQPVALTNCAGIWGCAFQNWGVMRGSTKVLAREWDSDWLCYDVSRDRQELNPLSSPTCDELAREAERLHGGLPGR
jgi:arylsulfatase A-like enzyme